jgi:hypothetical protein
VLENKQKRKEKIKNDEKNDNFNEKTTILMKKNNQINVNNCEN